MAKTLEGATLRAALVTSGSPWQEVEHHDTIGSTNARAAEIGMPWVVVAADHQSAGRGRLHRTWEAPPGTSVAVSATIPLPPEGVGWVPLLTGLAVAEAIEATAGGGFRAVLKWPNDVLLPADEERKVCGILGEVATGADGEQLVVVGAGINVSQTRDQLPVDTATSLALAGAEVDPTRLVQAYLTRLGVLATLLAPAERRAQTPLSAEASREGGVEAARAAYRARCATLGRAITITSPGSQDVTGTAVDVDDDGRLVVERGGERSAWAAGDVVHLRAAG